MLKRTYEKPTLESTINLYRKQLLSHPENELELEVKFDVQYIDFLTITNYLIKNYQKNILCDDHAFTDMKVLMLISAIKDVIKHNSMIRKDIKYYGKKNKTVEYINKRLLISPPYKMVNDNGINYKITLSSEKQDSFTPLNETSVIRVKLRLNIPLQIRSSENPNVIFIWCIDLSIIKEVIGGEAKTNVIGKEIIGGKAKLSADEKPKTYLSDIVDYLFKENTIEHF